MYYDGDVCRRCGREELDHQLQEPPKELKEGYPIPTSECPGFESKDQFEEMTGPATNKGYGLTLNSDDAKKKFMGKK